LIDDGTWRIAPVDFSAARRLAGELGVSETLAQILVRRGFADPAAAQAFLHPDLLVHGPYLLPGVREARRRVDQALKRAEPIAVYGDYDADGITATFLLVSVLEELGADVRWRLPNRFTDGYGVAMSAVEELAAEGVKLLVTVDCGMGARDEVERARELGMDVVVTDHHEIEGPLPECVVVSPRLPGAPCPQLAGVGVAFKLAHALLQDEGEPRVEVPLALRPYMDVVALGTVADLAPLVDENRTLVMLGLGRLKGATRPGLAALMEVAGVTPGTVTAGTVGFRLAPRVNAAGRLEDAGIALDLLACSDRETALPLALRLEELNRERQEIERGIFAAAVAQVREPSPPALVLSSPDWHEGVVGIVASRVAERFHRPTILLSEDGDLAKGSGRSIAAYDLLAGVHSAAAHLITYGGHRAACGLSLERRAIPAFREAFTAHAAEALGDGDLARVRVADAFVRGDELSLALADELELLAPHGLGNPRVNLLLHGAEIVAPRLTRDRRHLQYRVRCDGASCGAVHFNFDGLQAVSEPGRYDVLLALGKNAYNATLNAQVEVKALHRLADATQAPGDDLCPTACDASCTWRLTGAELWRHLLAGELLEVWRPGGDGGDGDASGGDAAGGGDGESGGGTDGDAARARTADAVAQARREGRLLDRHGRSAASTVAVLAATGERVLLLVADVARRRPLLTRDALPRALDRRAMYLQSACANRLTAAIGGPEDAGDAAGSGAAAPPDVVMAGVDLAAAHPELVAAFSHIVFVDPPFSAALHDDVVAAAAPDAFVHNVWGPADVHFSEEVLAAGYDLDAVLRRVWRALERGGGRFDDRLEQELLAQGPFLAPVATVAAALRVLAASGLLRTDGVSYELKRPQRKADMTTVEAHRAWRRRFHTRAYLARCLTRRR
jgi:single-stranded-DNA-specific exonuclease